MVCKSNGRHHGPCNSRCNPDVAPRTTRKARKYQIIKKPIATATGDRGEWSFVAHGATYTKAEADAWVESAPRYGYIARKLAV